MKLLRLLITVVLAAALSNNGYAQEPATPYGTPSGASKFDGKLYINGLLYPPVYADTPQVGTLYYPKRLGALIIKRVSADSGLVYIFMGNKWVELLSSNPGGTVDLSGYYDKGQTDSIANRLRLEFPIVMNPDWNASTGPSAILNKPSIPDQFILTSADGTITLVGTGSQLAISVTPNYFIPLSQKATSDGVATLDGTGKIPINQLPALTLNQPKGVQTIAEMLSSSAVVNDVYIVADSNKSYILANAPPSDFNNWLVIQAPIPTNTDLLPEGSVNFYFSSAKAVAALTGQNISLFNNNLNFISRVELVDSSNKMVRKTGNETLGIGIKTFTDSVRVVTPPKTDSSSNVTNTAWVKSQNYLASLGKLPPGAIPYANAQGVLTYDGTGLYWDGSSLNAGHSGFYNWVGLGLNGGRARLVASGFGAQFSTSGGYPMDASKSISFYNSITRYGVFSMRSSADSTLRFLSDMEIVPSSTNKLNLGSLSNQWNNTYTKNLYINGVLFVPGSGSGGGAVTSYNGRIGDIFPQSTDYSSFYKPLGYVPDWSEITNKQFIPTNNNQLPNGAGYITQADITASGGITKIDKDFRLGGTLFNGDASIGVSDNNNVIIKRADWQTTFTGLDIIFKDAFNQPNWSTIIRPPITSSNLDTGYNVVSLPFGSGTLINTVKANNTIYSPDSSGTVDLGNDFVKGTDLTSKKDNSDSTSNTGYTTVYQNSLKISTAVANATYATITNLASKVDGSGTIDYLPVWAAGGKTLTNSPLLLSTDRVTPPDTTMYLGDNTHRWKGIYSNSLNMNGFIISNKANIVDIGFGAGFLTLPVLSLTNGNTVDNTSVSLQFKTGNATYGGIFTGSEVQSTLKSASVLSYTYGVKTMIGNILSERFRVSENGGFMINQQTDNFYKSLYVNGTSQIHGRLIVDKGLTVSNTQFPHRIYTIGNSLTYSSGYGYYQAWIQAMLGSSWQVLNYGISGNKTGDILNRFTQTVVEPGDAEYVIIEGGINDIINDVPYDSIKSHLQTMYNIAKSNKIKVISLNIFPFGGNVSWTSGRQTILQNLNKWIKDTSVNVDYKIDANTALKDTTNPINLLPSYDDGGHLHLTPSGYYAVGDLVINNSIFTSSVNNTSLSITGKAVYSSNPTMSLADSLTLTNKKYVDSIGATKAPLSSPTFTGTPTAPTQTTGNNTTAIATTAFVDNAKKNLDASYITSGRLDTSHAPITNLYATDGIKATSNSSGITFKADTTVMRLGGNNDLLHNDTAHWVGLEKNDTLVFRVNGEYAGLIDGVHHVLSMGSDGMRSYFGAGYTGNTNVNFGPGGQYMNKTGYGNTSGGFASLEQNLVSEGTGYGLNVLRGNKYGSGTSGFGSLAGYNYGFDFESLYECTFLGAHAAPDDSWPVANAMYRSLAIGYGAKVTKSYQTVIGSPDTQETLIRGSVYANMVPRDSGVNTIDTIRLNVDNIDSYWTNSLATNVFVANPTGFLRNFKEVIYRIGVDGASHNISFGTMFKWSTDVTMPTTIAANKMIYIRGYFNSSDNTIDVLEVKNFN
jgi:hypothetical protein